MKAKPVLEEHYGVDVWTNRKMDKLRRTECLCLNCRKIKNCSKAQLLFVDCLSPSWGIALAVTRCKKWEPR